MSNLIQLSFSQIILAALAGVMRQVQNLKVDREPAHGSGTDMDWQKHVEGCLGECVFAEYLGVHWAGVGKLRAPDVGNVDCRTASRNWHSLIIHKEDPDDRVFWLLTGNNGTYMVRGWLFAKDGKKDEYWKDPTGEDRAAYFVPQTLLNPPSRSPEYK